MPRRIVKRWRGYTVRLKETDDAHELTDFWKKPRFVLAHSPKDALKRLSARYTPSGATWAKVEVERMESNDVIGQEHYGRTRTFDVYFRRELLDVRKA